MPEFYICSQIDIESKLKVLVKNGTSRDGWAHYYTDKEGNEKWVLTTFHSEYHGGGISVLKRLPEPSIDELIEIVLAADNESDICGASNELLERESDNKEEFRTKLIDKIRLLHVHLLSDFDRKRLEIVIYESELYDATNRRPIVGKYLKEIESDAAYYRNIAQIAKEILRKIKD